MALITQYESKPLVVNRKQTNPGDFEFVKIKIEGKEFLDKVLSLVIFEDMKTPYVSGELLCLDTKNMPSSLPIIGGEKISISVRDCFGDIEDFEFVAVKVTDKEPVSLGSMNYSIHFTSSSGILTAMRKVSKAYQNMKTEDITRDIIGNFLTLPGNSFEVDYEETSNPISCIIPNWRPSHALKWLASRAIASREDHSYSPYVIFQERSGKYTRASLDFFYDDSSNKNKGELTIKYGRPSLPNSSPTLQSDPRMSKHILSLEDFNIVKTTDYIENLMNGMYSNEVTQVNLFARVLESDEYRYITDFAESKHLNKYPFVRDGMLGFDEPSHWRSIAFHQGLFSDMDPKANINDYANRHIAKWQQTEQMVIRGVLPGHFGLRIGQKYTINIPEFRNISKQTQQKSDEYYSGQYLIEEIKHEFAADRHYYATVRMFTDSVSKKIEKIV
ncbi:tail protein [Rhizobium phage RHph_N34]|uniref:Putative structural protein n=1 Tax=Rhizobium phage RHph_N34 TaxID=2509586 RepID=A0A7S5RA68_9CAUD|nr:tail protein [Rhizobium phage RHph_N34]QIG73798.1 putative structural protein [Rhizobium phage RHph_N34]